MFESGIASSFATCEHTFDTEHDTRRSADGGYTAGLRSCLTLQEPDKWCEIMEIVGTGESSGEDEPCRVGEEGRIEEHIGIDLNAMSSGYGETI